MDGKLRVGCIADDFTGASDIASFFSLGGMKTVLSNGVPDGILSEEADAVVIALKSRSIPAQSAVHQSLQALEWLLQAGAEHIYIKYCSTFDSTPAGNIGPVCDAVMDAMGVPYTILCPALPVNGRTVKDGRLSVNGVPLHKSSMKDHPLNPMWDDRLEVLMKDQSRYPVFTLSWDAVKEGADHTAAICQNLAQKHRRCYIAPDFYDESQGTDLAAAFPDLKLYTGGSGLARPLAERWMRDQDREEEERFRPQKGNALLLAGSCSQATRQQIAAYQKTGAASFRIYPDEFLDGSQNFEDVRRFIDSHPGENMLIYSSASPKVRQTQKHSGEQASAVIEETLAGAASYARQRGILRIIVAGGETSGAVTERLGYSLFWIGESVAPGVPVMRPVENRNAGLVLKSGNFGSEDFFARAVAALDG